MQSLLDVSTVGERLEGADADEVMNAVADDRRRYALSVLSDEDSPTSLTTLATRVRRLEQDGEGTNTGQRDVAISLHHKHLPLLDELGVVAYDSDQRDVELDVDPEALSFAT